MPGRVIQDADTAEALLRPFGASIDPGEAYRPRYNIGPGQSLLAIRHGAPASRMRWGLPARQPGIGGTHKFARCESIRETQPFARLIGAKRCIVPITEWYEWPQPREVRCVRPVNGPLALAGIYDIGREGALAIITCEPNEFVKPLHHRMGVFLHPADYADWLDPATDAPAIDAMMRQAPNEWFREYRVSQRATRTRNDDPKCVEPISALALKRANAPKRYGGKLGNLR
jgi:putative SOS response-associated peptidase YedK